jgi:hypothetical protein
MDGDNITIPLGRNIQVCFKMIKFKDMEDITFYLEQNIKEIGVAE